MSYPYFKLDTLEQRQPFSDLIEKNSQLSFSTESSLAHLTALSNTGSVVTDGTYLEAVVGYGYLVFYDAQSQLLVKVDAEIVQQPEIIDKDSPDALIGFTGRKRWFGRGAGWYESHYPTLQYDYLLMTKPRVNCRIRPVPDSSGVLNEGKTVLFHSTVLQAGEVAQCYFVQTKSNMAQPLEGAPTLEALTLATPEQLDVDNKVAWIKLEHGGDNPDIQLSGQSLVKLSRFIVQNEASFSFDIHSEEEINAALTACKQKMDAAEIEYTDYSVSNPV
ncbi:hypothetical protein [Pseudoalteromonas umbrosa]|uniref:hypothetical protein n=1 Tax=Pseudoalteromonas umbrosa TaxID=3048489 RepID=UPI0024C2B9A3|nr:hypothetical protein [Pseudoalteromonas sp. B95]MDK1290072.1 hypothetical protein [Pseudoalteromonas sp. B95]